MVVEIGRLFEAEADGKAAGSAAGERLGRQSTTQKFDYGLRGLVVREERPNLQFRLVDIRGSLAESAQIRSSATIGQMERERCSSYCTCVRWRSSSLLCLDSG
jgi:hypothetical protein